MNEYQITLTMAGLLHDIGILVCRRDGQKDQNAAHGAEKLQVSTWKIQNDDLLRCIRYPHLSDLRGQDLPSDSMAYLTAAADAMALAVNQKENPSVPPDPYRPLESIFDLLNGNHGKMTYAPGTEKDGEIRYPQEKPTSFTAGEYDAILGNLQSCMENLSLSGAGFDLLRDTLEENLSYVPARTAAVRADVSLYDHAKLTCAMASCISLWLTDRGEADYAKTVFDEYNSLTSKKVFLLASMDVSGIQKFIYTITSKNALRMLRARSFYLEILMEHVVDEVLERLELSRANLIYSGGGHCYLLLPNTENAHRVFGQTLKEVNAWFLKNFATQLYIAGGCAPCSANDLCNNPEGSYSELFRSVSSTISEMKSRRYKAEDMIALNRQNVDDYTRECTVCRTLGKVDDEGLCPICHALKALSANVLYASYFVISRTDSGRADGLPLPFDCTLFATGSGQDLEKRMADPLFVRAYGKNAGRCGSHALTRMFTGSYTNGETFEELAEESTGIKRIGVLRADVDNLGQAFVSGFEDPKNNNRYVTLSRTAALSRQLSLFFKYHINQILEESEEVLPGDKPQNGRRATIVYSGGDDLFIVGAWSDVVELALDLKHAFAKYTESTLTISAGIGLYQDSYPISVIAEEVGAMVDRSKDLPGKNAITILENGLTHEETNQGKKVRVSNGTYSWKTFEERVLADKLSILTQFMETTGTYGNSFLYHLLELIRRQDDKINFARYVYLLSRMEPDEKAPQEEKDRYQEFSNHMVMWVRTGEDRRELESAIELYVYLHRDEEGQAE